MSCGPSLILTSRSFSWRRSVPHSLSSWIRNQLPDIESSCLVSDPLMMAISARRVSWKPTREITRSCDHAAAALFLAGETESQLTGISRVCRLPVISGAGAGKLNSPEIRAVVTKLYTPGIRLLIAMMNGILSSEQLLHVTYILILKRTRYIIQEKSEMTAKNNNRIVGNVAEFAEISSKIDELRAKLSQLVKTTSCASIDTVDQYLGKAISSLEDYFEWAGCYDDEPEVKAMTREDIDELLQDFLKRIRESKDPIPVRGIIADSDYGKE